MELHLIAECVDGGHLFTLSVGPNADPKDLGLSKTSLLDHTYSSLDELCKVVLENCSAGEVDVPKLRSYLTAGKQFHTPISRESALGMGFKPE